MTPAELAEFNANGCGCRCLIELAKITPDDFMARFRERYKDKWTSGNLGAATTAMLIDMARELGLCTDAVVHVDPRSVISLAAGVDVPPESEYVSAIIGTDKPAAHFVLVVKHPDRNNRYWSILDPQEDGTMKADDWDETSLQKSAAYFLMLYGASHLPLACKREAKAS